MPTTESVIRRMTRLAVQHDAVNLAQGFTDEIPAYPMVWAAISALLGGTDYCVVVASIVPRGASDLDRRLIRQRDRYERLFVSLVEALALAPRTDRRLLRLALLSALNGVLNWYRPGADSPRSIARKIVRLFRRGLDRGQPQGEPALAPERAP